MSMPGDTPFTALKEELHCFDNEFVGREKFLSDSAVAENNTNNDEDEADKIFGEFIDDDDLLKKNHWSTPLQLSIDQTEIEDKEMEMKPLTDSGYGPEITDSPEEMAELDADPLLVTRMFLLSEKALAEFQEDHQTEFICEADRWTETFYDTVSSSLSNAECILKQDSYSPRYWKFFCFAQDNIMEITTDEQEIKEPLSRLLNFTSPDQITKDLLKPFFKITNVKQIYLVNGCNVQLTVADYGFAFCRIERYCMGPESITDVLAEIDHLALTIGCRSLAAYEPIDYLLKKRRTHSGA